MARLKNDLGFKPVEAADWGRKMDDFLLDESRDHPNVSMENHRATIPTVRRTCLQAESVTTARRHLSLIREPET